MKDKDITSQENRHTALRKRSSSKEISSFLKAAGEVDMASSGRLLFLSGGA